MTIEYNNDSQKDSTLDKIKSSAKEFHESNVGLLLRAIVAAVPFGGAVTEVCNDLANRMDSKRIEQLLGFLERRIADTEKQLIEKKSTDPNWNILMEHAITKARLTSRSGQIEYISKIISESLHGKIPELEAENLINVVSELSGDEAKFFGLLGKRFFGNQFDKYGEELLDELGEEYKEKLAFLCTRLEARGLIKEKTGAILSYNGGSYTLTYVGQRLLRSISS